MREGEKRRRNGRELRKWVKRTEKRRRKGSKEMRK